MWHPNGLAEGLPQVNPVFAPHGRLVRGWFERYSHLACGPERRSEPTGEALRGLGDPGTAARSPWQPAGCPSVNRILALETAPRIEQGDHTSSPEEEGQQQSGNGRFAGKKGSRYDPERGRESDRLRIQAERAEPFDREMLRFGIERLGRDGLTALDLGCGDGYVTETRLIPQPEIDLAVGVDKNDSMLAKAAERSSERLAFRKLDLDSASLDDDIAAILTDLGRDRIDVVLAALALHHLAAPVRTLRSLRRFIGDDGFIVARSKDDAVRVACPDDAHRVDRLLDSGSAGPGSADRTAGRKMHRQLKRAGFKNVRFFPRAFHTVGMSPEGRHELFLEAFSFRRNYWAQVVDNDPSDDSAKRQLARIDDDLADLELDFEDEAFFYLELSFGFVGFS